MPLTMFMLDEQVFTRVSSETEDRSFGRKAIRTTWASICRACEQPYFQSSCGIARSPSRFTRKKCVPCLNGKVPPIKGSSKPNKSLGLVPIPGMWTRIGPDTSDTQVHENEQVLARDNPWGDDRPPSQPAQRPRKSPPKGAFSER